MHGSPSALSPNVCLALSHSAEPSSQVKAANSQADLLHPLLQAISPREKSIARALPADTHSEALQLNQQVSKGKSSFLLLGAV